MKRSFLMLSIIMIVALLMGTLNVSTAYTIPQDGKTRVMVQFLPGKKAAAQGALNGVGAEFHYAFDELNTFVVTLPSAALDGISRNPNVVLIEEDAPRYPIGVIPSVQDMSLPSQVVPYGIDMVQARAVWDANGDGVIDSGAPTASNRKICIIDSGFYTAHEDLQGVTVSGYNGNLTWNQDGSGHGTHVAGTIAAMNNALGVIGVTPGTVQIYVVRVFGDDGLWAYSSTLIDAAYKCRDAGANIISMSLGGSRSNRTEMNGFNTLYNTNGILSIAAAGNGGTSALHYPASYDSVISVAAIDSNKAWADFSQYNSQVELAAPGVGVLSTVPYLDNSTITVDGVTYSGGYIDGAKRGSASGVLVNGERCTSAGAWTGKVVLCERGDISFYDKTLNVLNGGGIAAVIYNNVPGGFLGTLGDGITLNILSISLSQEDGQYLVNNKIGLSATVSSTLTAPASGYEYYDGTSMATPHVSAVAALVWSAKPTATNAQVRQVLQQTAQDLGTAGRDVYYGYGLVQAKAAVDAITGGGGGDNQIHVGNMTGSRTVTGKKWNATVTITVLDQNNAAVSGVVVTGSWSGAKTGTASCTTGTNGACSVSTGSMSSGTSVTYTVTNLAKTGYTYNASANVVTSITVTK